FPLRIWEPLIKGKGGSCLRIPTPNTMDHLPPKSKIAMEKQFSGVRKGRSAPSNLREWIHPQLWPTHSTRDVTMPSSKWNQRSLSKELQKDGGKLNPQWVEWLMGYPIGWTELKPLEIQ